MLRARLRRRPVVWWAITGLLAVATAQVVAGAASRAEDAAARWGMTQAVLVATADVAPGSVLHAGTAEVADLPVAAVPAGAAGAGDLGAVVTAWVHEGEVVHRSRLAPGGLSLVAARLPAGTRGVAVPIATGSLPLEAGDTVDVLATVAGMRGSGLGGTGADAPAADLPPTVTVTTGAAVVDVAEGVVTVAVPVDDAPRVAYAVATGIVTLVLSTP